MAVSARRQSRSSSDSWRKCRFRVEGFAIMKRRRWTAITREGWQYLLIFALVFGGALVNDVNLLLILGSMLAGPLLLSRHLSLFTLRGLTVQRRLPRPVCAGDLLVVHMSISNTRRRVGSWILVLEEPIHRLSGGREV